MDDEPLRFSLDGTLMERTYVRRRPDLSWHIVRTHTRMFNGWVALCGRRIEMLDQEAISVLPGNEKSCESCARYALSFEDRQPVVVVDDDGSTHDELVP